MPPQSAFLLLLLVTEALFLLPQSLFIHVEGFKDWFGLASKSLTLEMRVLCFFKVFHDSCLRPCLMHPFGLRLRLLLNGTGKFQLVAHCECSVILKFADSELFC